MKRTLAILLAVLIAVGLCACGGSTTTQETTVAPTTAATTEATTVATTVETTEPEPEYTYVDITMDNWQEYFTLSEPTPVFEGDEFKCFEITLSLNEPYRDKVACKVVRNRNVMTLVDQKITVEVSYTEVDYKVNANAANQTVSKTKAAWHDETDTIVLRGSSFSGGDGFTATLFSGRHTTLTVYSQSGTQIGSPSEVYTCADNLKITNISGSLPLLAE